MRRIVVGRISARKGYRPIEPAPRGTVIACVIRYLREHLDVWPGYGGASAA